MPQTHRSIIGLDVGAKRIGVAVASLQARLPRPLTTLIWDDSFFDNLKEIITTEDAGAIVVGLPRGLDGQETSQTYEIRAFNQELQQHVDLPMFQQDEAVTSRMAEEELEARGKDYSKADIDALAATYILQDFLDERAEEIE